MRTVFGAFAVLLGAWSLARALRSGVANSYVRQYRLDGNPLGYSLCIMSDIGIVLLGAAMILHVLGIIGDPIAAIDALLPPS